MRPNEIMAGGGMTGLFVAELYTFLFYPLILVMKSLLQIESEFHYGWHASYYSQYTFSSLPKMVQLGIMFICGKQNGKNMKIALSLLWKIT